MSNTACAKVVKVVKVGPQGVLEGTDSGTSAENDKQLEQTTNQLESGY